VGTIVSFHAHPDDEAIASGGTLARAAAAGHRVVLVFATRGELGEPVPGVLGPGEQLAMRRSAECYTSAAALGAKRVEFLGFTDSGMMGEPSNDAPFCFWQADVEYAARTLAVLLDQEEPDVLTIYDDNGVYGHPDHIQVHRVGIRAAAMAGTPRVYESTMNRDFIVDLMKTRAAEMADIEDAPDPEEMELGVPAAMITTTVDVSAYVGQKRAAMVAHASQIPDDSFFLQLPLDAFAAAFGQEWFIRRGPGRATVEDTLVPVD
jgi:LmbE family N-acetylglucosaminyl deacetylase